MNDVVEAPAGTRKPVVRPRDAASLILLRGEGRDLEVLAGRRPLHVKFMPGVHVFPGGAIDPPDRTAWSVEAGSDALGLRLARSARAALRETWEEVGVLVGRPAGSHAAPPATRQIERAYRERGLVAALDLLTYVGRAITPSHSNRRFNTRFFLSDGANVLGEPASSEELEDVRWYRVGQRPLESFRDVTRFMLARAIALHGGTAKGEAPLFYWAKNARRIGVCREAAGPTRC
ncbi:MAG: NUDIX domain-containing protein [Acetobacteraceae bacterium]|nr:NUDIX domain-containing protein [Acetobacteraceae bacterium]